VIRPPAGASARPVVLRGERAATAGV